MTAFRRTSDSIAFLLIISLSAILASVNVKAQSVDRLKADVSYLASDALEGRGISTRGIERAARHIRAEFKRIGLKSATPDGTYFQSFSYRPTADAPEATLHNVIGVLEGSGAVANETIVIGAHYDHLGYGSAEASPASSRIELVHPGADDNASGIAALLELARRFTAHTTPRSRRLIFAAFSGEEAGLIGSRYYVSTQPLFPIKETIAMINFDMLGRLRNNELGIAGNESAKGFDRLLFAAAKNSPLKLLLGGPEYPDDSDHASFAKVGVPILYLCTGSHDDRHTPADTAGKINYEGLANVVNLSEQIIDGLLVMPRPTFVPPPGKNSAPAPK